MHTPNEIVEAIMQMLSGMSLNDALQILTECTEEAEARARL